MNRLNYLYKKKSPLTTWLKEGMIYKNPFIEEE